MQWCFIALLGMAVGACALLAEVFERAGAAWRQPGFCWYPLYSLGRYFRFADCLRLPQETTWTFQKDILLKRLAILGSTGSIGQSTLSMLSSLPTATKWPLWQPPQH